MIAFILFFGISFCIFLVLAFFARPLYVPVDSVLPHGAVSQVVRPTNGFPFVPQTVTQARLMDPYDFELLSAAVIIAMGQGHSFYRHCGQSGDQGVDVKLRNIHEMMVAVQSKRYAGDNHVTPEQVLSFWGAIHRHNCIYGYFVTSSTFSSSAWQIIHSSHGLIRVIDENQLAWFLQQRSHEIAMAYSDILHHIQVNGGYPLFYFDMP